MPLIYSEVLVNPDFVRVDDLDYGYAMDRDFIGGEWIKTKLEEEGYEQ